MKESCIFYIIYSKEIDSYYTGHTTVEIGSRVRRHNSNHGGYTGRADDWKVLYSEEYDSKEEAYAREREVKSWKSRSRIEKLIGNSE